MLSRDTIIILLETLPDKICKYIQGLSSRSLPTVDSKYMQITVSTVTTIKQTGGGKIFKRHKKRRSRDNLNMKQGLCVGNKDENAADQ